MTPQEWFEKLNARFTATTAERWKDKLARPMLPQPRDKWLDTLWSYRVGDPPLPQIAPEFADTFKDALRKARSNHAPMCVQAMLDRTELEAISTNLDGDTNGDDIAAEIMEETGLQTRLKDMQDFKYSMGESFGMVVPPVGDAKFPTVHAIDPRRCVGIVDDDNPVRLKAALVKSYNVEEDIQEAHLFLPGGKWTVKYDGTKWANLSAEPDEVVEGLDDLGGIPVVRLENPNGLGEYEPHVDVLDRIIDTTLMRIVIMKFQGFKQRGVSGDEDEDDLAEYDADDYDDADVETRNDLISEAAKWDRIFKAGPGAVWKVPAGWKFWESGPTDLTGVLQAKRDDVKEFAAVTFTPLYLVSPDDANGSATGADVLRESLTSKCRDRRVRDTPALKLLWRIIFAMCKEPRTVKTIKLEWGPIEFRSLSEKASATTQVKGTLSMKRILTDIWDMSPQEAQDNINELVAESLLLPAATTQPQTSPARPAGQPPGGPTGRSQPEVTSDDDANTPAA